MGKILKIEGVRLVFHDKGVKRITRAAIHAIDEAVENLVGIIAEDVLKVYPNRLIETDDIVRVCKVGGEKYTLVIIGKENPSESDIEKLVRKESLPDFDPDELEKEDSDEKRKGKKKKKEK